MHQSRDQFKANNFIEEMDEETLLVILHPWTIKHKTRTYKSVESISLQTPFA